MTDRTTIIIYGKGGVGKSTIASHLSVCFRRMGKRVLLVGCDPKADTSVRLLGGQSVLTIVDMVKNNSSRGFDDNLTRTESGVDVLETGGPAPGMGCGGRGVATLCQFLDEHSLELGGYDVVIFDVLGDLVCGGFISPLRFGNGNSVYIVSSEEPASLFAANNIARVVCQPYYDDIAIGGILFNLRANNVPAELLERFAARMNVSILGIVPRDPVILDAEEQGQTAVTFAPESAATKSFFDIAAAILARCASSDIRRVSPLVPADFWTFIRENRFRA